MGFGRVDGRPRGIGLAVSFAIVCAFGFPAAAGASILTVTSTVDNLTPHDGQCTLREAIAAVNSPGTSTDCGSAQASGTTIVLGPHAYTLSIGPDATDDNTTGDLDLTSNSFTTIQGAGVAQTSITGAGFPATNPDRLFHVVAGSLSIVGLTLTRGVAPDGARGMDGTNKADPATAGSPGFNGGAILNGGDLGLADVAVTDNVAGNGGRGGEGAPDLDVAPGATGGMGGVGGGIASFGTLLELNHVTVSGNFAGNGGDGGEGGSNPVGNGANGGDGGCCADGGGVYSGAGLVRIENSTFTLNHAGNGGAGGPGGAGQAGSGVAASGGSGAGGGSGGGVALTDGRLEVTDSTFVSNFAGSGGNGGNGNPQGGSGGNGGNAGNGSAGGGLFLRGGTASTPRLLHDVTVADNDVGPPGASGAPSGLSDSQGGAAGNAPFGGGVYTAGPAATSMQDTLLAANALGNCAGSTTDGGTNLGFGDGTCPGGFATGDPKLGRLKDNGGPTQTVAIGIGSAAQNKGTDCLPSDQRGAKLPSTQVCDIGAYELKLPEVSLRSPTRITTTGAKLNGSATANNATASVVFKFGKTTAYGSRAQAQNVTGFTSSPVSADLSGLSPGTTYHYRLRATSSDGTTTSADATFTTARSGGGGGAPGSPRLTRVSITPRSFFAAPNRHHKTGATISYTDSAKSRTTFVVFAQLPGTKLGGRCVKHRRHRRKTCSRLVRVGSFTHADRLGRNAIHFTGRLGGHKLASDTYVLKATPRASNKNGLTASAKFTIKRVSKANVRALAAVLADLI